MVVARRQCRDLTGSFMGLSKQPAFDFPRFYSFFFLDRPLLSQKIDAYYGAFSSRNTMTLKHLTQKENF